MTYDNWKTHNPADDLEPSSEEAFELLFQEARNTLIERAEELYTVAYEIDSPDIESLESLTKEIDKLIERYSK